MIHLDQQRRAHCYPCRADVVFEKSGEVYVCARGHRRQIDEPSVPRKFAAAAIRFWERVTKTPYCWNWEGSFRGNYQVPRMFVDGGDVAAATISWVLATGVEPTRGLWVVRSCHNIKCVRPDHLVVLKAGEQGIVRRGRRALFGPKLREFCRSGRHRMTDANRQKLGKNELCRACRKEWRREYERERKRAAREAAREGIHLVVDRWESRPVTA